MSECLVLFLIFFVLICKSVIMVATGFLWKHINRLLIVVHAWSMKHIPIPVILFYFLAEFVVGGHLLWLSRCHNLFILEKLVDTSIMLQFKCYYHHDVQLLFLKHHPLAPTFIPFLLESFWSRLVLLDLAFAFVFPFVCPWLFFLYCAF